MDVASTSFAIPDFQNTKLCLIVQLGDPLTDLRNLVIFFTHVSEVNWETVKELVKNPNKQILSLNLSSSPWSYRCCDYTVGALLGLIELLTGKHFLKMPNPIRENNLILKYYELS
jgi:hypothetical protein